MSAADAVQGVLQKLSSGDWTVIYKAYVEVPDKMPGSLKEVHDMWKSLPTVPILLGHMIFCVAMAPEARWVLLAHCTGPL